MLHFNKSIFNSGFTMFHCDVILHETSKALLWVHKTHFIFTIPHCDIKCSTLISQGLQCDMIMHVIISQCSMWYHSASLWHHHSDLCGTITILHFDITMQLWQCSILTSQCSVWYYYIKFNSTMVHSNITVLNFYVRTLFVILQCSIVPSQWWHFTILDFGITPTHPTITWWIMMS